MRLSLNWFLCSTFWLTSKSKIFFFPSCSTKITFFILCMCGFWYVSSSFSYQISEDFSAVPSKKLGLLPFSLNFQRVVSNILFVLLKRLQHKIYCSDLLEPVSTPAVLLKAFWCTWSFLRYEHNPQDNVWAGKMFSITRRFFQKSKPVCLSDRPPVI